MVGCSEISFSVKVVSVLFVCLFFKKKATDTRGMRCVLCFVL